MELLLPLRLRRMLRFVCERCRQLVTGLVGRAEVHTVEVFARMTRRMTHSALRWVLRAGSSKLVFGNVDRLRG